MEIKRYIATLEVAVYAENQSEATTCIKDFIREQQDTQIDLISIIEQPFS